MRITLVLEPEIERELRRRSLYKGDMSKIVNLALKEYFAKNEATTVDDFVKKQ